MRKSIVIVAIMATISTMTPSPTQAGRHYYNHCNAPSVGVAIGSAIGTGVGTVVGFGVGLGVGVAAGTINAILPPVAYYPPPRYHQPPRVVYRKYVRDDHRRHTDRHHRHHRRNCCR
ncbi:MAG: hypothetical protein WAV73_05070 [Candidatus Moraniibacteriota bacterium]